MEETDNATLKKAIESVTANKTPLEVAIEITTKEISSFRNNFINKVIRILSEKTGLALSKKLQPCCDNNSVKEDCMEIFTSKIVKYFLHGEFDLLVMKIEFLKNNTFSVIFSGYMKPESEENLTIDKITPELVGKIRKCFE